MKKYDNKLLSETEALYGRDFLRELIDDSVLSEEESDDFERRAAALIHEFGWSEVFSCWNDYLRSHCHTAEEALNFANLFWVYEGYVHPIEHPYDFLAWFYYCIDMKKYADDAITIMDSISIEILSRAGIRNVGWNENPYYVPEEDPEMIAAVQRISDNEIQGIHASQGES